MLLCLILALIIPNIKGNSNVCPDVQSMENFDLRPFARGRLFEIGRYEGFKQENGGDCTLIDYFIEGDNIIAVLQTVVDKKTTVKLKWTTQVAPDDSSKIIFTPYDKNGGDNTSLHILDTDYDNYVILYNCDLDHATGETKEIAWVNSRSPNLNSQVKAKIEKFMESHPFVDETRMIWDHFGYEDCLMNI